MLLWDNKIIKNSGKNVKNIQIVIILRPLACFITIPKLTFQLKFYAWVISKAFEKAASYGFNPILFGRGAKMPYPLVFLKYLQNYLLNWLEIFKVWFSNCLKAVLKKLLKIGVRKALNHALSWMTSYRKKSPKIFFSFFSIIFHFLSFPCCVC